MPCFMHMYTWRMTFLHEIVLVYVSHMKTWVQSFLHEIWNLHFTFENLVVYFWSWYMVYGMLHIWMSVHTFSYMNMELRVSHIGQFEPTFSCLKYGILYIFSIWKSPLRSSDMKYVLSSSNMKAWCKFSLMK